MAFVDTGGLSRLDLAAIAQAAIIVGVNIGLVGALASLLEEER